jgi:CheY-like chemotaxis protein
MTPTNTQGGDIMGEEAGNPIEIFLVEDNAGDVRLTREAFVDARVPNRLHVVHDGIAALQFLRKEKPYAGAPDPDLVLLDLNIPKMSGFEVLEQIKSDPQLRRIPVIILTSSKADCDVWKCYSSYANSYVTKPADFDQYVRVIASIDKFWLSTVRLPGREI